MIAMVFIKVLQQVHKDAEMIFSLILKILLHVLYIKCLELGVKIFKLYFKYPLLLIFFGHKCISSKGKKKKLRLVIN